MLMFAGVELARSAKDIIGNKQSLITAFVTAAFIVGINTLVGFFVGIGISLVYSALSRRKYSNEQTKTD